MQLSNSKLLRSEEMLARLKSEQNRKAFKLLTQVASAHLAFKLVKASIEKQIDKDMEETERATNNLCKNLQSSTKQMYNRTAVLSL